jgi:hypothetical protein
MITAHLIPSQGLTPAPARVEYSERRALSRLIAAAVINQRFCSLLLANPSAAINQGFNGESFELSPQAKELVLSIHAASLAEFANALEGARISTPLPIGGLSSEQYTQAYFMPAERMIHSQ